MHVSLILVLLPTLAVGGLTSVNRCFTTIAGGIVVANQKCGNRIKDSVCEMLFEEPTNDGWTNATVDQRCYENECLSSGCSKRCLLCCEDPKYNCSNVADEETCAELEDCGGCRDDALKEVMIEKCPKTCGFCDLQGKPLPEECPDKSADCHTLAKYLPCTADFMVQQCSKTCGIQCTASTAPSVTMTSTKSSTVTTKTTQTSSPSSTRAATSTSTRTSTTTAKTSTKTTSTATPSTTTTTTVNDYQKPVCDDDWSYFAESCYWTSELWMIYNDAKAMCASLKSKQVSIGSEDEKAFIMKTAKAEYLWIGLEYTGEGGWQWSDGSMETQIPSPYGQCRGSAQWPDQCLYGFMKENDTVYRGSDDSGWAAALCEKAANI